MSKLFEVMFSRQNSGCQNNHGEVVQKSEIV